MYEFLCFIILLLEEILHHLGCIKPHGYWDIYYINWLAEFLNHQAVRGCFELFTDRSAGLERLSKWAQKKKKAEEANLSFGFNFKSCRIKFFASWIARWTTLGRGFQICTTSHLIDLHNLDISYALSLVPASTKKITMITFNMI